MPKKVPWEKVEQECIPYNLIMQLYLSIFEKDLVINDDSKMKCLVGNIHKTLNNFKKDLYAKLILWIVADIPYK